jgi:hypothetical protein
VPPASNVNGFQKAELRVEGGETIPVLFNPREYSIAKTNAWTFKPVVGSTVPPAQFGGGNARTLTLNGLLLDKSLAGPSGSIVPIAEKLFKLMATPTGSGAGGAKAAPPLVTFAWGQNTTFKAVITSLTIAYKLFQPNGDPIRADVNMALTEAEQAEVKAQNPTTRAEAGLGVHTVRDGDSLQSIAYRVYGDATRWRTIAEINGIDDPMRIRRGTPLMLPRLEG